MRRGGRAEEKRGGEGLFFRWTGGSRCAGRLHQPRANVHGYRRSYADRNGDACGYRDATSNAYGHGGAGSYDRAGVSRPDQHTGTDANARTYAAFHPCTHPRTYGHGDAGPNAGSAARVGSSRGLGTRLCLPGQVRGPERHRHRLR